VLHVELVLKTVNLREDLIEPSHVLRGTARNTEAVPRVDLADLLEEGVEESV
jgi:hypothetical protein